MHAQVTDTQMRRHIGVFIYRYGPFFCTSLIFPHLFALAVSSKQSRLVHAGSTASREATCTRVLGGLPADQWWTQCWKCQRWGIGIINVLCRLGRPCYFWGENERVWGSLTWRHPNLQHPNHLESLRHFQFMTWLGFHINFPMNNVHFNK